MAIGLLAKGPVLDSSLISESPFVVQHLKANDRERELFTKLADPLLKREAWGDSLAYLSGQYLMVPLHGAFELDEKPWQDSFTAHMGRLVDVPKEKLVKNPLSRLQYLYIASQYLVLQTQANGHSDSTRKLEKYLYGLAEDRWLREDAIAYGRSAFTGVKARVEFKLGNSRSALSHYKAITDEEMFLFAICADLSTTSRIHGSSLRGKSILKDVANTSERVFKQFGVNQAGGGWLFQPGAWADHPDNAVAGSLFVSGNPRGNKKKDVSWDSSHFHRFSAFVNSYRQGAEPDSPQYAFFSDIKQRMGVQFVNRVLVKPSSSFVGYRTTNYMDGWNGVYRYGLDKSLGPNKGYQSYQLSGTFLLGWWAFLDQPIVSQAYLEMTKLFPLSDELRATYEGPAFDPSRKALSWYQNGWGELFVSLASRI